MEGWPLLLSPLLIFMPTLGAWQGASDDSVPNLPGNYSSNRKRDKLSLKCRPDNSHGFAVSLAFLVLVSPHGPACKTQGFTLTCSLNSSPAQPQGQAESLASFLGRAESAGFKESCVFRLILRLIARGCKNKSII